MYHLLYVYGVLLFYNVLAIRHNIWEMREEPFLYFFLLFISYLSLPCSSFSSNNRMLSALCD